MTENVMTIIKQLKGLTDDKKDAVVTFAMGKAMDDIKNYCHILEIPPGLESTIVSMSLDILDESGFLKTDKDLADGRVESIKEGDTTVNLMTDAEHFKAIAGTPSFAKNYKSVLNVYRKVAFGAWT